MGRKILLIALLGVWACCYAHGQEASADDEVVINKSHFFALGIMQGAVLSTNNYISEYGGPKNFSAVTLKFGFSSPGDCWEDIAYGMPYGGVGIYAGKFSSHKGKVGTPISLFVFQGGQFFEIGNKLTFNYEWNLGMAFGWIPYDAFDNPYNIAIGSSVNVHIAANFYLRWTLSPLLDLDAGLNVTHFSNGDSRLPNAGFNMVSPSISLNYHFKRKQLSYDYQSCYIPPAFKKTIDHDISMTITARQAEIDTVGTGMPSPYIDRKFKVLGIGYALLFSNTYRYKWGPGFDFVYDESSGIRAWREVNPGNGKIYDRTRLGSTSERISLGLSVKGELVMPRYSIFANVGWNVIYGNKTDAKLYQIFGIKVYLKDNLFGTFGIRASHFSSAQYLYWSLGYTIAGRERGR